MTVEAIKVAILTDDLEQLVRYLPTLDVFALNRGFDGYLGVLDWAVQQKKINSAIIQLLLDLRDERDRPVIDINKDHPIFSLFCNHNIDTTQRRKILEAFLSQKSAQGGLIKDFKGEFSFEPLLKRVVNMDASDCLEILLKARDLNGESALEVNEVTDL